VRIIKTGLKPQGLNLGMNLGKVSGAGVADHIHLHIVPRWTGDTNFMPIVAETKIVSIGLKQTYEQLKRELNKLVK
jgi:ATP adenylyltransferase